MAYKRDLSKPLAPTFGDDKPKKKVKRKTKEVVNVRKPKKDSFSITQKGVKKTIKRKDGSVKRTVSKTRGNLGVTPSTGKENQKVRINDKMVSGILPVTTKEKKKYKKDGTLKKSKRTDKEGSDFYDTKTTTKVNRKGDTSKKVVKSKRLKSTGTVRSQMAADRLSDKLKRKEQRPAVKAKAKAARAVNKSKRQSERTKSKATASLQKAARKADRLQRKADRPVKKAARKTDRLADKKKRVAARKAAPKKRRVVTRTKNK